VRENGFPRTRRLLKSSDFKEVRKKGQRHETEHFTVFQLKNRPVATRLGFAVSARVANAVERNRIKRLLREFFRLRSEKLKTGDLFIIVKRVKKKLSRGLPGKLKEVETELEALFQ
jgi:ribonuclease P protein component